MTGRRWSTSNHFGPWWTKRFRRYVTCTALLVVAGVLQILVADDKLQVGVGVFWLLYAVFTATLGARFYRHRDDPPVEQPVVRRPAP